MALAERYEPRYCAVCGDLMPAGAHGPAKVYCSKKCQRRAERARKAARAGLPASHPSLRAAAAPVQPPGLPVTVPRPRPAPAPVAARPAPSPAHAVVALPCQACGRASRLYRLRGYDARGRLVAETAALCAHHKGLAWAVWQGRFGMPAITAA